MLNISKTIALLNLKLCQRAILTQPSLIANFSKKVEIENSTQESKTISNSINASKSSHEYADQINQNGYDSSSHNIKQQKQSVHKFSQIKEKNETESQISFSENNIKDSKSFSSNNQDNESNSYQNRKKNGFNNNNTKRNHESSNWTVQGFHKNETNPNNGINKQQSGLNSQNYNNKNSNNTTHGIHSTYTQNAYSQNISKVENSKQILEILSIRDFDNPLIKSSKPQILQMIEELSSFSELTYWYSNCTTVSPSEGYILNTLVSKSRNLSERFEDLPFKSKCQVAYAIAHNIEFIQGEENLHYSQSVIADLIKTVLLKGQFNFKILSTILNILQFCPVEDKKLLLFNETTNIYSGIMSILPQALIALSDSELSMILLKSLGLSAKLKSLPQMSHYYMDFSQKISGMMCQEQFTNRLFEITQNASKIDPQTLQNSNNQGQQQTDIRKTLARLAQAISKQISHQQMINPLVSEKYRQIWQNMSVFFKKNHKIMSEQDFKGIMQGMVSQRIGDDELFQQLLVDFHKRVTRSQTHLDFFCTCFRLFATARHFTVNMDKQLPDFKSNTMKCLGNLQPQHKLTLITTYVTIGEADIAAAILDKMTLKDIKNLNFKGQIQLFWSVSNIEIFTSDLLSQYIKSIGNITNQFLNDNPLLLVQATQTALFLRENHKDLWNSQKNQLEDIYQRLAPLTHSLHSKVVSQSSIYSAKNSSQSFDIGELISALGVEFVFEPIVEDVFNVDFLIKGVTKEKLIEIQGQKEEITNRFIDLKSRVRQDQNQMDHFIRFDGNKHTIDKKQDILLEIDGASHFISGDKKRQASLAKHRILEKMGYRLVSIDYVQLKKFAKNSPNKTLDFFLEILESNDRA